MNKRSSLWRQLNLGITVTHIFAPISLTPSPPSLSLSLSLYLRTLVKRGIPGLDYEWSGAGGEIVRERQRVSYLRTTASIHRVVLSDVLLLLLLLVLSVYAICWPQKGQQGVMTAVVAVVSPHTLPFNHASLIAAAAAAGYLGASG